MDSMDFGTISIIDSGTVSITFPPRTSTSVRRKVEKVSRSYSPVSFYMDSADNHPGPIRKGVNESKMNKLVSKNRVPLSLFNETLAYYPAESLMYIFVPKEEKVTHELSFYVDPSLYHPARKIYCPSKSVVNVDYSQSKSVANVGYSQSKSVANVDYSKSKSVANVTFCFQSSGSMAKVSFGSFDSQSSELKPTESKVSFDSQSSESKVSFDSQSSESKCSIGSQSSETKSSESKLSFRSVGSQSSATKSPQSKLSFRSVGSDSSESKSSQSKLSFRTFGSHSSESKLSFRSSKLSFGSQSSESKSSESKLSFGSFGSDTSESKSSESKLSFGSFASDSSESKSSQSKLSFGSFASDSSESKSSQSKLSFGSFASDSSESKSVAKVSKNYIPLSTAAPSSKSMINRNHIPDALHLSILSKLPVKSLKRFRCACKSWSILFDDPHFMTMYANHFISRHRDSHGDDYHTFIMTNHYHSEFYLLHNRLKLNLPSPLQHPGYCSTSILGSTSVKGIFCLGQYRPREFQYVLWNPLTSEFMVIPSSPSELAPGHPHGPHAVYREHRFHGFGYDQFRHDFKVIQYVSFVCPDSPFTTSFIEIYSLKNNSWRMIDMDNGLSHWAYTHCMSFSGRELYLDGACHWLVYENIYDRHSMALLSFDLTLEAFLTTPIGEEPYNPYSSGRLTVLNGSIALISNYHDDLVFQISILGELGVSESWIKLYTYGPFPSIQWPPIGFGKMGPIFFKKKDYEVVYVDLSTQITEEVGITGGRTNDNIGGLYKESLLSLKDHVTWSLPGKPSFVGGSCNWFSSSCSFQSN